MTIPVWFDVEYTDAALDKKIGDAKKKGGDLPKRKYSSTFLPEIWRWESGLRGLCVLVLDFQSSTSA